jgi:hypothetical protein
VPGGVASGTRRVLGAPQGLNWTLNNNNEPMDARVWPDDYPGAWSALWPNHPSVHPSILMDGWMDGWMAQPVL